MVRRADATWLETSNAFSLPDLPHAPVDSNEEENHATKQEGNTETQVSRDQEE
jgi:hypothetical protein